MKLFTLYLSKIVKINDYDRLLISYAPNINPSFEVTEFVKIQDRNLIQKQLEKKIMMLSRNIAAYVNIKSANELYKETILYKYWQSNETELIEKITNFINSDEYNMTIEVES